MTAIKSSFQRAIARMLGFRISDAVCNQRLMCQSKSNLFLMQKKVESRTPRFCFLPALTFHAPPPLHAPQHSHAGLSRSRCPCHRYPRGGGGAHRFTKACALPSSFEGPRQALAVFGHAASDSGGPRTRHRAQAQAQSSAYEDLLTKMRGMRM